MAEDVYTELEDETYVALVDKWSQRVTDLRRLLKSFNGVDEEDYLNEVGETLVRDFLREVLADSRATAFWEKFFYSTDSFISGPIRHMLRAAYRKRATLNRAKARTGDLFEEDTKGTLNTSLEPVPFDAHGRVYLEQRPSLKEKPFEPHPEKWAGMGAVIDNYERPEEAWLRVEKKFEGARIVQAVLVPLDGILPRHVFDPDRGPFILHVVAVLLDGKPNNPRGGFFTREEVFKLDLVNSHRDIILPAALTWYDEGGFGTGSEVYDLDAMRKKD